MSPGKQAARAFPTNGSPQKVIYRSSFFWARQEKISQNPNSKARSSGATQEIFTQRKAKSLRKSFFIQPAQKESTGVKSGKPCQLTTREFPLMNKGQCLCCDFG